MTVISRRTILAGGAGLVGGVGLAGSAATAAPVPVTGEIDLAAAYGVVANKSDLDVALENTKRINKAIEENPTGVRLVLPAGSVYVRRNPEIEGDYRFAAILIAGEGKSRLELAGRGVGVTTIVMTGTQDSGLTRIIEVADGPSRITLCDFSVEHGPGVTNISPGLQNHQIELNAGHKDVTNVEIRDVFFGTCIGDAIRLAGGETATVLRNTTIRRVTMRLGKHPTAPDGCRSGISFQRGISDLLLTDFFIVGPKNSPLDMEPTAANPSANITITNGTIDNTEGKTWFAVSFDGFGKNGNPTSLLSNSRIVNVHVKGGQLQVVNTLGCTLDNIVIEADRNDVADAANAPLLLVFHKNEDLAIRNVSIVRGAKCQPGPLVVVQHTTNNRSPKRVTIEGGTWTTRVGPGSEQAYAYMFDASGVQVRGTRIRVEHTPTGDRHGMKFRSAQGVMSGVHLDGVTIDAPDGLTSGFVFGAVNNHLTDIAITGCSLTGTATRAVFFTAANGFAVERFPILQGNDFDRAATLFIADQQAANSVFPVIAGNRGGPATMTGAVAPEGVVAAGPGAQYVRQNANAPELWWKATGTGPTGWKKLA